MDIKELKVFLDQKAATYADPNFFIETDPIQIPHSFSQPKDQEIAGFLTALISWGQRKTIITNAKRWMQLMDDAPHDFLLHAKPKDYLRFGEIKHRTLNGEDAIYLSEKLAQLIKLHSSIDNYLCEFDGDCKKKVQALHNFFVLDNTPQRTAKHIANPIKGSAAKRLCMFSRVIRQAS